MLGVEVPSIVDVTGTLLLFLESEILSVVNPESQTNTRTARIHHCKNWGSLLSTASITRTLNLLFLITSYQCESLAIVYFFWPKYLWFI